MKQRYCIILLLPFALLTISGCSGYQKKMYPGPEMSKSELTTITTENQFTTIGYLDGEIIVDKDSGKDLANHLLWGHFPTTITVMPGKHRILPCVQNPYVSVRSENWLEVEAKPGETYIVKSKFIKDKKSHIFWIEKKNDE